MTPELLLLCGLNGPPPAPHLPPMSAPPPAALQDHEAFEGVVEIRTSAHFAFKWGADWSPDDEAWIDDALEGLERAWTIQVQKLGMTEPDGMQIARFNAYIADSGVRAGMAELSLPASVGGVYGVDPDGWPFLAVSHDLWADDAAQVEAGFSVPGEWVETALAHEFQHAVQGSSGVYTRSEDHWWWEGMATWAQDLQVPDSLATWSRTIPLLCLPELPFDHTDLELWAAMDQATEEEIFLLLRVYGTFVLPLLLSEEGMEDLVVTWATDDGGVVGPLERLDELLAARGETLGERMAELWASTRAGTLSSAENLALILAEMEPTEGMDHRVTMRVEVDAGEVSAPSDLLPGRYGANVIEVVSPPDLLRVSVSPYAAGTEGTPVDFSVSTIRCGAEGCRDAWLGWTAGPTTWEVDATGLSSLELVLVPVADVGVEGERFGYSLRLDPSEEERAACACGAAPAVGGLLPLLLVLWGRQRRIP